MLSLLRKKKKKELTIEESLGILHLLPNHLIVMGILNFLEPKIILQRIACINSRWNRFCCTDELWKLILEEQAIPERMKIPIVPPFISFYRNFAHFWRLRPFKEKCDEKKYYTLKENNMLVTSKNKKIKNTKKLRPILTENKIQKGYNQVFRVLLSNGNLSGCGVCISDATSGTIHINYHADGSISRANPDLISCDNRIQYEEGEDGKKKKIKVMLPLEKDFVFNVFISYDEMKIHYFFNDNFEERITCTVYEEMFDNDLFFGLKVNFGQEMKILSSLKNLNIQYPNRKKSKRIYKC